MPQNRIQTVVCKKEYLEGANPKCLKCKLTQYQFSKELDNCYGSLGLHESTFPKLRVSETTVYSGIHERSEFIPL